MPTGKVKFYDDTKGFGFISADDGGDVHVGASALPAGVGGLKPGQRVEFSIVAGKRGTSAMSVRVLDQPVSLAKMARKPADEMVVIVEDLVKWLDTVGGDLRHGHYPAPAQGRKIAAVLRKVADDLEA